MTYGWQFLALFVAVVVISNILSRRRRAARRVATTEFAQQHGLVAAGNENPLLGAYAPLPPPPGIGVAPPRPHVLEAIASGRGTVQNVLRGSTLAGEVLVLDHRMPPDGGDTAGDRFVTWAAFRIPGVPTFHLFPRPRFAIGLKVVEFDGRPGLAKRFAICPADEGELRRHFTPAVLAACEGLSAGKAWQISAGGGWVLATFGLAAQGDLGLLLDASSRVAATLRASCRAVEGSSP